MDKYLFDKYIASRFLGTRINDPMVSKFMDSVKDIINELISNFLFDYAQIRSMDMDLVIGAYKQYYELFINDPKLLENHFGKESEDKIYKILHDEFFYSELEKRINKYISKMYDKYVPALTEKAKQELSEYIKQKNIERNQYISTLIERLDKNIEKTKKTLNNIQDKIDEFNKKNPSMVVVGSKIWTKEVIEKGKNK